eukprot:TRINITY_DN20926_c0_g1_i1.p1 TRINITY_DN20926_c0_g1~~TRINITY_DN20926_c0_g1_i1.p1  ORF type:complete len:495 (-),score=87.90 TRINITY_DN20926_c0_g1_i1:531-2015(-)
MRMVRSMMGWGNESSDKGSRYSSHDMATVASHRQEEHGSSAMGRGEPEHDQEMQDLGGNRSATEGNSSRVAPSDYEGGEEEEEDDAYFDGPDTSSLAAFLYSLFTYSPRRGGRHEDEFSSSDDEDDEEDFFGNTREQAGGGASLSCSGRQRASSSGGTFGSFFGIRSGGSRRAQNGAGPEGDAGGKRQDRSQSEGADGASRQDPTSGGGEAGGRKRAASTPSSSKSRRVEREEAALESWQLQFWNGDVVAPANNPVTSPQATAAVPDGTHTQASKPAPAPALTPPLTPSTPRSPLKLPQMSEESLLLDNSARAAIYNMLPALARGREWVLLYSTAKHGISLLTLYRRSALSASGGPCLLVIGDTQGVVFGALASGPLQPSTKKKYQGSSDCFVFTDKSGGPQVFRPSGFNRYFVLCMNDSLSFGGGGHFALQIDGELMRGSSGPCETFSSPTLTRSEEFAIKKVELWSFAHASRYAPQKSAWHEPEKTVSIHGD